MHGRTGVAEHEAQGADGVHGEARGIVARAHPRRAGGAIQRSAHGIRRGVATAGHDHPARLSLRVVGVPDAEEDAALLGDGDAPAALARTAPPQVGVIADRRARAEHLACDRFRAAHAMDRVAQRRRIGPGELDRRAADGRAGDEAPRVIGREGGAGQKKPFRPLSLS